MPPEALAPRFGLDCAVQQQINQTFAGFPHIERVTLYGSRAKGNYRPGSDIDLAISAPGMTQDQLCDLENRLDDLPLPLANCPKKRRVSLGSMAWVSR